jgi:AbrB family looped-hinge helix DNA binding protein
MSSKGQVTIPKAVRDSLGLGKGAVVEITVEDNSARLRRASPDLLELYGSIKPPTQPEDWSAIREQVEQDVARRVVEGRPN